MSIVFSLMLFGGVKLFFLKDSPNLLVKVTPEVKSTSVVVNYSFAGDSWRACTLESYTGAFDAVITPPETLNIIGIYYSYRVDAAVNVDDNKGMLYIFEVKKSPRMMMPFSISDLERILAQARKKITANEHVDEAVALLDYAEEMLRIVPYRKGSELEMKKQIYESEVNDLRKLVP